MKKTFIHAISILVILGAVSAASGFCKEMFWSSLLNSGHTLGQASAVAPMLSSMSLDSMFSAAADNQILCEEAKTKPSGGEQETIIKAGKPIQAPGQLAPCCQDGGVYARVSTISETFNALDFLTLAINTNDFRVLTTDKLPVLQSPILSPPEQKTLLTTVIRI